MRRLAGRLLLALLATVAALGLAELILRWGVDARLDFAFEPMTEALVTERGRFERHPHRFYTLAPGFRHAEQHLGRYALGDWPFRGPPPQPRPQQLAVVAVVGDSCVYGLGLDAADTLPHQLALALERRGLGPDRVLVLNLGVPGYSTLQIDELLAELLAGAPTKSGAEALADIEPDAVVLYPAAWNDQAPALWKDDVTLFEEATAPDLATTVRRSSRLVSALHYQFGRIPTETILESWSRGEPRLGPRVPADETAARLASMTHRLTERSLGGVVIAPAHSAEALARHPRLGSDADRVRAAAVEAGLPLVDGQRLLGPSAERDLLDMVHPSARGSARLAEAVAAALAPTLTAALADAPPARALRIATCEPSEVSVFGDVRLTITLGDSTSDPSSDSLPDGVAITVGGAPLLDLRRTPEGAWSGVCQANAAGSQTLVVRSRTGVGLAPDAVRLLTPSLTVGPDGVPILRSRPGDRCRLYVATSMLDVPRVTALGDRWLGDDAHEFPHTLVADEQGVARAPRPADLAGIETTVYLQGLVAPPGDPAQMVQAARWTAPLTLGPTR